MSSVSDAQALGEGPCLKRAQWEMGYPTRRTTPPMNQYEKSDLEDAERTLRWLSGADMTHEKKWIVEEKNIPCAWFAIKVLAPQNGIKRISKAAAFGKYDKRFHAIVFAGRGSGKLRRVHSGASSFGHYGCPKKDKQVALAFAARNCIRQLLPMQPNTTEKVAWKETKKRAAQREGADGVYA